MTRRDRAGLLVVGRVDLLTDDGLALRAQIDRLRGDHVVNAALARRRKHDLGRVAAAQISAVQIHADLILRCIGRGAAVHRLRDADLTVLGHVDGKFHRRTLDLAAHPRGQPVKLLGRIDHAHRRRSVLRLEERTQILRTRGQKAVIAAIDVIDVLGEAVEVDILRHLVERYVRDLRAVR